MTKLSKHERLNTTHAIEDTLDNYCRASCPYFNLNTPSPVCATCPVAVQLQEYGAKLIPNETYKKNGHKRWTDAEDSFLIKHRGIKNTRTLAEDLKRSPESVRDRIKRLRAKGLI